MEQLMDAMRTMQKSRAKSGTQVDPYRALSPLFYLDNLVVKKRVLPNLICTLSINFCFLQHSFQSLKYNFDQ